MGLRDPPAQDELGSSYSYNPQYAHAYQHQVTPPQSQQNDGQQQQQESDDALSKMNRYTDHHTIVDMRLRLARFLVLVIIGLGAAFTYATATNTKLVLTRVVGETGVAMSALRDEVNLKLSNYNALFGTIMFAGSKIFEVYMETFIFPTLHTYLHNCSLFPGDQPQRVHSKVKRSAIFWSLKTVVIFMNVGFASLYVGQSTVETEKVAVSRRLAAAELMETLGFVGFSPSLSLPATAAASESDVLNTILRTAVTGSTTLFDPTAHFATCFDGSPLSAADVDTTSVAFGFASHDWSAAVLRHGVKPRFSVSFAATELDAQQQSKLEQQLTSNAGDDFLSTARELLTHGVVVLRSSLGQAPPVIQSAAAESLTSLADEIANQLNASVSIDASKMEIGFAAYELAEDVSLVSMTIDVPVVSSLDAADAVLCGTKGCVRSHKLDLRLKPEISILPYTRDSVVEENAAFLYGLGRSAVGVQGTSAASNPRPQEILSLSFGKMTWRASPLHVRHQAECVEGDCLGLSVSLSSTMASGVVLVGVDALPSDHMRASPEHPLRLVALNPVAIPDARGAYVTWGRVISPNSLNEASKTEDESRDGGCSTTSQLVDSYLEHVDANKLFLEKPLQAMYTSALLYLLQNGVVAKYVDSAAAMATSRRLQLTADAQINEELMDITVGIPLSSSIATFAGCGIMLLLTVFVIWFPTDRVKLSPDTTPAAQYVQILTDDLYPDVVHKKRLRFANGDGLLFNEYVVDSIVLHAKRNEKKKIYL